MTGKFHALVSLFDPAKNSRVCKRIGKKERVKRQDREIKTMLRVGSSDGEVVEGLGEKVAGTGKGQ